MEFYRYLVVICSVVRAVTVVNASVNTSLDPKVATFQSSAYSYSTHGSDLVVDGCTTQVHNSSCCSHTQWIPELYEAWWQVDLGEQVVIEYIQIYYRDETVQQKARFAGYQIYLSNTSSWSNVYSCYTDTTPVQSMVDLTPRITSCTGNTRYLTIYVERQTNPPPYSWYSTGAILELCEVQVYGCPVGKYGNGNCDNNCDTPCVNSLCHPNSGKCTLCIEGYFGGQCKLSCPVNCQNRICDQYSGVCTACIEGYYGGQCEQSCPVNCQNRICDQYSGVCTACIEGYFGGQCEQSCPVNCQNRICVQYSNVCAACIEGYFGGQCELSCPVNCQNRICDQYNGVCTACIEGYFDGQCELSCPVNCQNRICDQYSGVCTACIEGYFGGKCELSCPVNCQNRICDQHSSVCAACHSYY